VSQRFAQHAAALLAVLLQLLAHYHCLLLMRGNAALIPEIQPGPPPCRSYLCDTPFPFAWAQLLVVMLLILQFTVPFVIVASGGCCCPVVTWRRGGHKYSTGLAR
jgi:hypothetical protein